jgi:hypothetical protein
MGPTLDRECPGSDVFLLITIRNDRLRYIARVVHSCAESSGSDVHRRNAICREGLIGYSSAPPSSPEQKLVRLNER